MIQYEHIVIGKFFQGSRSYDIAILELSERIVYSNFIQPICLESSSVNIGTQCKLSGIDDDFKINEAGLTKISSTFCEARFDGGKHFVIERFLNLHKLLYFRNS